MKICVCLPVYGESVRFRFAVCLSRMVTYSATLGRDIETLGSSGILPDNRNQLAARAIQAGAEWTLWLDSDQTFPSDTLERLLAHNLPIVGANYLRRDGSGPTAGHVTDEVVEGMVRTIPLLPAKDGVEPVDFMGLGVALISPVAFRAVNGLFKTPPFEMHRRADGLLASEDYNFFAKAKKAGFTPHVDHGLSLEVGHLAETELRFPSPSS